jgi:hypothetical protein
MGGKPRSAPEFVEQAAKEQIEERWQKTISTKFPEESKLLLG